MAPPHHFSFRNLFLLYLLFFLFSIILVCALSETDPQNQRFLVKRQILEMKEEEEEEEAAEEDQPKKKLVLSTKNKTKLLKPKPKPIKPKLKASTNSTKKTTEASSKTTTLSKTKLKKLNSTKSNPTSLNKSSDPLKPITHNNKTSHQTSEPKSKNPDKKKIQKPIKPYWMDQEDDEAIVSELKELPSKFQQELIPDLQRISTTSQAYLTKANKEITNGFKPLVGKKFAPTIASILACIFIIVPLLLVSLIFNRIKAFFSLQKILIFIQVYLSIYFSILSLSSLVTGLEPLKFFYATSQSSYVCLQVLQTLGYVFYVLLLVMYLVVVFSKENGLGLKLLGLGQTMVGIAVGFHYYATVFHWAVLRQPPKTNWKVQGIYAVCFLVICLFAGAAERRKKAYLYDGGEGGKKS